MCASFDFNVYCLNWMSHCIELKVSWCFFKWVGLLFSIDINVLGKLTLWYWRFSIELVKGLRGIELSLSIQLNFIAETWKISGEIKCWNLKNSEKWAKVMSGGFIERAGDVRAGNWLRQNLKFFLGGDVWCQNLKTSGPRWQEGECVIFVLILKLKIVKLIKIGMYPQS